MRTAQQWSEVAREIHLAAQVCDNAQITILDRRRWQWFVDYDLILSQLNAKLIALVRGRKLPRK